MATWKKVIVSGSTAALGNLTVTNGLTVTGSLIAPTITGSLQGTASYVSGSVFTSANPAFSASYAVTASYLLGGTATPSSLTNSTGITSFTFNGSTPATVAVSGASTLSTDAITKWTGTAFANSSLTDNGTNITGTTSIRLSGASSSLTGSFTGSFIGTHSGSFSGSYAGAFTGTASYASVAGQTQGTLTLGNGLTGTSFNGSTNVTTAVGAGALITVGTGLTSVSTSSLSANQIPKYSNNTLSGSNITDTGTQVQIAAGAISGLSVAAGGITVTGNSTFSNNLLVSGDLTVAGTASFQNTQNLLIADKFILLNSGSTALSDSGIILAAAGLSGSAFYIEAGASYDHGNYGRFAIAAPVNAASASVTADEYMVSAKINQGSAPVDATPPTWGISANGGGNMWIQTNGDIYIWS